MDFGSLKRDSKKVLGSFLDDTDNATWIAKEDVTIIFPKRYLDGKLGNLDSRFNTLAIFAIVVGDSFSVYNVAAIMPLTPVDSTIIKIEGLDYYKLSWSAGDVMCPNTKLVLRKSLAFEVYDEFLAKGRIPPYMDNVDHVNILATLEEFCGVNLGADAAVLEIYNPATTRSPSDRTIPLREFFEKQSDFVEMEADRIPLRSVAYGADNTTARMHGSYLNQGINSSLVNPSDRTEVIEQILTS